MRDNVSGNIEKISCDFVINAAGVWAGQIANLASLTLNIVYDKGTMVEFDRQYSNTVLNRSRPQNDGDLLVPNGAHSILGTTTQVIKEIDECIPSDKEVSLLIKQGTQMIPELSTAKIKKAYSGIRPLYDNGLGPQVSATRQISRSYQVIDHKDAGIENLISIVGGKVTIYRRMAESAVDLLCLKNDNNRTSTTA